MCSTGIRRTSAPMPQSLRDIFFTYTPTYKSRSWRPLTFTFLWQPEISDYIRQISPLRCQRRLDSYIIPGEFERSQQSIRFGHQKTGRGFHAKRGDFCLVGGVYDNKTLTLLYRNLEMIGGLYPDLILFNEVEKHKGPIKLITIHAVRAFVFARKLNSGEKLHARLLQFYGPYDSGREIPLSSQHRRLRSKGQPAYFKGQAT
jgi:hypothetical protein